MAETLDTGEVSLADPSSPSLNDEAQSEPDEGVKDADNDSLTDDKEGEDSTGILPRFALDTPPKGTESPPVLGFHLFICNYSKQPRHLSVELTNCHSSMLK
jgi:hypothetical protein